MSTGGSTSSLLWKAAAGLLIVLILVAAAIRIFVFQLANVPDHNMQPGLVAGDSVLVDLLAEPGVGDLVLVRSGNGLMIRRVAATAGQNVAVTDGFLVVDGEQVPHVKRGNHEFTDLPGPDRGVAERQCVLYDETLGDRAYTVCLGVGNRKRDGTVEATVVPADSFYVLCDNRLWCATDSRDTGPVSRNAVVGRVSYLLSRKGDTEGSLFGRWDPL